MKPSTGEKITPSLSHKTWQERFEEQFPDFKERETYFFEEVPLPTAIKNFIASLISDAEQKARDSERNKIFAILRYLEIPHTAKEIMKIHKEWESSRLSLQDNHQSE